MFARRLTFPTASVSTVGMVLARMTFAPWRASLWASFLSGGDHAQRDASTISIDVHHPNRDDVADRDYVVGTLDVAVGHLADVDESAVFQPDVDERSEVYDVEDFALEFHSRLEIFEFEYAFSEDRLRTIVARVAAGSGDRFENIEYGRDAGREFGGDLLRIRVAKFLTQPRELGLVEKVGRREVEVGKDLPSDRVTFRVNPGDVERLFAFADLEEARRLGETGFSHLRNVFQLFARLKRSVVLAILDQFSRGELIEARDVPQQRHTGGIQIDSNAVYARFDDRFDRFLKVFRPNVVLIKTDADVLGVDFHKFRERILQTTTDGNCPARGRVEIRELIFGGRARRVVAGAGLVHDDVNKILRRFRKARQIDGRFVYDGPICLHGG